MGKMRWMSHLIKMDEFGVIRQLFLTGRNGRKVTDEMLKKCIRRRDLSQLTTGKTEPNGRGLFRKLNPPRDFLCQEEPDNINNIRRR